MRCRREWQHRLHVATSLVGAAVCALFFWVSTGYVLEVSRQRRVAVQVGGQVEKWAVMAIMPPGLALLALQFVRRAWRDRARRRPPAV